MSLCNIVFDVDEVLIDTMPLFVEALNNATGRTTPHDALWSYNFEALYGLQQHDLFDIWSRARVLERAQWLGDRTEFVRVVTSWLSDGHNVYACTARGWHPEGLAITHAAVNDGLPMDLQIVMTRPGQNKVEALLREGIVPTIAVDDMLTHVQSYNRAGAEAWLYRHRWNYMDTWGNNVTDQTSMLAAISNSLRTPYAEPPLRLA